MPADIASYLNITQALGLVALLFDCTAFAIKDDRRHITLRTFGCLIWIAHYAMLGKMVPSIFLALDFIRFASANHIRARPAWLWRATLGFGVTYVILGLTFQNNVIDLLPMATAVFACYCTFILRGINMRIGFTFVMISWLIYNFMVHSIGGVINDGIVVMVNLITIFRMMRDARKEAV